MTDDRMDGSRRIAWSADGYEAIDVYARWRPRADVDGFARTVADAALMNRTVADLQRALRRDFGGDVEIRADRRAGPARIVVSFLPPPGEPNPDE
jgi:hypothetical protein